MTVRVLASSTITQTHRVRLIHGGTGEPITAIALAPGPWPHGWSARVAAGNVLISRRDGATATVDSVDVEITDPHWRARLVIPQLDGNPHPDRVRVALDADAVDHVVMPREATLRVRIAELDTGAPAQGRTVSLRRTDDTEMPLSEEDRGEYVGHFPTWDPTYQGAELRIGSAAARRISLDPRRLQTRIDMVDRT